MRRKTAVYLSLLAIHQAQVASLAQQSADGPRDPKELLAISIAKGGSSVLADGYLVAGDLSAEEADFFFGYGIFLQLLDDLQDVRQDLACGRRTLFTETRPLDGLTNRLYHFLKSVLTSRERFAAPHFDLLKELVRKSCTQLLLQAVATNRRFYTWRYLRSVEKSSPVRFSYLRKQHAALLNRSREAHQRLRRENQLHSIFETMS